MARNNDTTAMWQVISVMEVTGALKNQRVCITGHVGLPRKDIEQIIVQAGGIVHSDVHSDTTMLVTNQDWTARTVGEVNGKKKSSKMIKAERNGRCTKILSEEEFCQVIISNGQTAQMPVD